MDYRFEYLAPVVQFETFVVERAYGNYIIDANNNKVLDVNAGQFCAILGHSNPDLEEVISQNAKQIQHTCTSIVSENVLKAAENLNRISGKLDARSLFLSTGSEAVEACLRYGKCITKKDGVICFTCGYHGLTLGSQSITYSGIYAKPMIDNVYSISAPRNEKEELTSIKELEKIIDEHVDEIGLILLEPVVSVGGLIYPSATFFVKVRELSKKNNILLAFDESQTGFARTGDWFAYQAYAIVPDFVICSKAIGLGYPVAVLLFAGELIKKYKVALKHYSSHQNDPLAADIVNFGINYIEKNNLLSLIKEKGRYFLSKLRDVEKKCAYFSHARGKGLMLGIDFSIQGVKDYHEIFKIFHKTMLENGVLIQGTDRGRVLRFLPGYLISDEEIDYCIDMLIKSYNMLFKNY